MRFIYCFKSEWLKKRGSLSSWLVIVGAFFTPVIVVIAKLVNSSRLYAESTSPKFWEALWNSSWQSMAIFLLPMGVILATSLITQLEYKNNTWKQLHTTPQKFTTIFFAKLTVITTMMLQFFILFNVGVYLSGVLPCLLTKGVPYPKEAVPYMFFLKDDVAYFIDCLPIIALQYLVSLLAKNFLVPVGGGIALWILAIAVLSWRYGYLIPYTYCGFNYLKAEGRYNSHINIHLMAIGYFITFTVAGYILYVSKKEKG
jgi:hypothetical protein